MTQTEGTYSLGDAYMRVPAARGLGYTFAGNVAVGPGQADTFVNQFVRPDPSLHAPQPGEQ